MFLALILSLSRKLCFVFCLIALCNPSSGQDFPVPVLIDADQERYTTALLSILRDWESGKITFQKTSNLEETFIGKMSDFQGRQQQFYVESSLPMEKFIIENWQRLPEELKANKPLLKGAILLLVASIVDSTPELKEMGVEPNDIALRENLEFPLYITLAAAQEEADKQGAEEIDATIIRRGGVWFFSLGWPFCCADQARP